MKKYISFLLLTFLISCFSNEKKSSIDTKKLNKTEKKVLQKVINKKRIKENINVFRIGKIKDKDGFTNIREGQKLNSKILGRVSTNEYFFYKKTKDKNWYKIKTLNGKEGFIHSSRVLKNSDTDLISISIFSFGYDENEVKDTIMSIKNLNENILIKDFNYEQLKFIKNNENSISFYSSHYKVKLSRVLFKEIESKIVFDDDEYTSIRGKKTWGIEMGPPKYSIKQLEVFKNNIKIGIDSSEINTLFEPNIDLTKVYETDNGGIIIWMNNGDSSGAYSVIFFIDKTNSLYKYIYRPF